MYNKRENINSKIASDFKLYNYYYNFRIKRLIK